MTSHNRNHIRNHIRRLRFEAGELTQEALAQRCGATRQTIISLEAGKYTPSLELAFRIARALGTNVETVFEWQAEQPASADNSVG
jgi:putative transcriptional regulator